PTLLPLLFLGAVATFFIVAYLINPAAVRFGLTGTLPIQLTGGSAGSADTSVSSVFMDSEWKTSSASVAVDPKGGMHMAFYYYEPQAGEAPTGAGYQFCARNCENGANWRGVRIGEAVNEVQLALTPDGKPRVLYRATSEGGLGDDFFYAACERNCTNAAGWTSTKLFSSAGTELFDIYDDDNPQRSFALDPEGRPRYI
ncbi:MAG TPA: hypothetical protein VER55_01725, partial [Ardenticatenaceae bacterium]|nr:hypothetical protein [Ardenticatenaceae bacterium]